MLRAAGKVALVFCVVFLLGMIWSPEHWWQMLASAAVFLTVGAAILGQDETP